MRLDGGAAPLADAGRYVLGMPHLCPSGLSENWLWKELGHRHWGLIARAFGRAGAGFGPAGEPPVYAAFRGIALAGGDLASVGENDVLDVRSTLASVSEARVVSRHVAACRERLVAEVEMTSVFVRRCAEGVNRSIVRVRITGGGRVEPAPGERAPGPDGGGLGRPADTFETDGCEVGTVLIEPCPHLDFNGAGLLYFSSFIAAVDRAEWRLLGKDARLYATRARRAVFHANIEVGDDLTVRLLAERHGRTCRHRALLHGASCGRLLAEVVSDRAG